MQHDNCAIELCPRTGRDCLCDDPLLILIQWSFEGISETHGGAFDVALRSNRFQDQGKIGIKLRQLRSEGAPGVHLPQPRKIIPFAGGCEAMFQKSAEDFFRHEAPVEEAWPINPQRACGIPAKEPTEHYSVVPDSHPLRKGEPVCDVEFEDLH